MQDISLNDQIKVIDTAIEFTKDRFRIPANPASHRSISKEEHHRALHAVKATLNEIQTVSLDDQINAVEISIEILRSDSKNYGITTLIYKRYKEEQERLTSVLETLKELKVKQEQPG